MTLLTKVIILAILQGVGEFIPISSSGHLVLVGHLLSLPQGYELFLVVFLHGGTLFAMLTYYWRELWELCYPTIQWKIWGLLIIGTLPAAIVGISLDHWLDTKLQNPSLSYAIAGIGFFFSFLCLSFIYHQTSHQIRDWQTFSWKRALIVGITQTCAILPGLSRSGTTISVATRVGCTPRFAAQFSFFLAIPITTGAILLKMSKLFSVLTETSPAHPSTSFTWTVLVLGFVISGIVGYFSLVFLIKVLHRWSLRWFGLYCLGLSVLSFYLMMTAR